MYRHQASWFVHTAGRLPAVKRARDSDFFTRARSWGATLVFLAGLLGFVGSFLSWVDIEPPPRLPTGEDFEGQEFGESGEAEAFNGVEAGDGWIVVGASVVLVIAATLLVLGRRTGWLAFVATIPIGAIAVADYRAVSEPTSRLSERMNLFGEVSPGIGLLLVAVSALVGLIGSVVAIAATPPQPVAVEE
jgi:hypothetical protein